MVDGIIDGNGDSRLLQTVSDALTTYPTYNDFMTALIAGTFPIDLLLGTGWDTVGTPLSKSSLLTDAVVAAIEAATSAFSGEPTVSEAFNKIVGALSGGFSITKGTYTGNGTYGSSNKNSLALSANARFVIIAGSEGIGFLGRTASYGRSITGTTATTPQPLVVSLTDNTWYWYNATNATNQLNLNNTTYTYLVFEVA